MRALLCLTLLAAAGAAACRPEPPAPPPPPDVECEPPGYHFAFVETDTTIYRQGGVVRVTPMVNLAPAGTKEIPLRCTSGWKVTGPAALSPDRKSVVIDADAPVGSKVVVAFEHAGAPVARSLAVIGKDEVVLTGRWSQREITGCPVTEEVRELEFQPGNRFSVTFRPFESYRDYWGTYSFNPATGQLRLSVEGGNFIPPGLDLEGRAELSSGRLVLKDLFLGGRESYSETGCTYTF